MARSRNRKKTKSNTMPKFSPKSYVRKKARQLPLKATYINSDWQESGLVTVSVVRQMHEDYLLIGSYIVDIFCLGVKDATFKYKMTEWDFENEYLPIFTVNMGLEIIECDPQLAFNVVYGAVEYAEDLGFYPHKDFNIAEYILPPVEEVAYMDIEFGKNGKPLYIQGPNDNSNKIMAQLARSRPDLFG